MTRAPSVITKKEKGMPSSLQAMLQREELIFRQAPQCTKQVRHCPLLPASHAAKGSVSKEMLFTMMMKTMPFHTPSCTANRSVY